MSWDIFAEKISNSYLIIKKIRSIMKNTQVMQSMSIVWLSIFMLGITMMSCNSKKEQQLPTIGKFVALFDYFSYKGNDDFYISNPLSGEDYFYNPILPGWYSDPSVCTN